uniref:Ig-like domain-containing protein n=1 Tax=Neogobius melanostomus TaxID=47308 RepID=A0A8C6TKC5_9GOBI
MSLQLFLLALGLLGRGEDISGSHTAPLDTSAAVERGASVFLRCRSNSDLGYHLNWHLLKGTESPKLLIYYATNRHTGASSRFSGSGSGTDFTLTISGFEAEDEGVYYSLHDFVSLWLTFGGGTRLELNLGRVEPALTVLPPSRSELAQGKATLMCLANKGFPSDWRVSWKVSGAGVNHSPKSIKLILSLKCLK